MTASFEGGRSQLPTNSKANDYKDDLHHRLLLIVRLQRRELREPAQAVRGGLCVLSATRFVFLVEEQILGLNTSN
jgi:hypothetical protein